MLNSKPPFENLKERKKVFPLSINLYSKIFFVRMRGAQKEPKFNRQLKEMLEADLDSFVISYLWDSLELHFGDNGLLLCLRSQPDCYLEFPRLPKFQITQEKINNVWVFSDLNIEIETNCNFNPTELSFFCKTEASGIDSSTENTFKNGIIERDIVFIRE